MRISRRTLYHIPVIVFLACLYCSTWLDSFDMRYYYNENPVYMVSLNWDKPFIFRILNPLLARMLYLYAGIKPAYAVSAVVIIGAVFMYFSLIYFFRHFLREAIFPAFLCALAGVFLTSYYRKIYDFSTIGFFALAFGLLARGRVKEYLYLYPLATFNRETTFLLTLFFIVYLYGKLPWKEYLYGIGIQGFIYVAIKVFLSIAFWNNAGKQFQFDPVKNMGLYMDKLPQSMIILISFFIVMTIIYFRWKGKPEFLRVAFLSIFPLQIVLFALLGYAFELRVLAESLPIVFLLCTPLENFKHGFITDPAYVRTSPRESNSPSQVH